MTEEKQNMENYEPNTIDEYLDLLQEVDGLDVHIVQVRKDYRVLQVNAPDPKAMRKELVRVIGPKLGIDFMTPRKTKKDGYTLEIPTYLDDDMEEEGEPIVVRIKKGGSHRAGRKNEEDFQGFIKRELEKSGICHLDISDNYGVRVKLDIVEVIDASASHGKNGEQNRSDTTVRLTDGTLYGISHKKTNATYVCKAKKMFHQIIRQCGHVLREYAKEHGMQRGDYMDVRITNRELIDLCWFGTDISTGAVFIGDFEDMKSGEQHIERIIRNGDEDVLTSFPIYTKWLIVNNAFTIMFCGVSIPSKGGKWIVDDVEVPGVNAPMPNGKKFRTGNDEQKKRRKRRKKKRVSESEYKAFCAKDIPTEDEIPTKEEIEMGGASFMGTPLKYVPNLHEEANHDHDEYIAVSDKLFNYDKRTQLEILVHEKCHEIAHNWLQEVWANTINAEKPFVHKKPKPNDPDDFFFDGITGICGGNAVDENFT